SLSSTSPKKASMRFCVVRNALFVTSFKCRADARNWSMNADSVVACARGPVRPASTSFSCMLSEMLLSHETVLVATAVPVAAARTSSSTCEQTTRAAAGLSLPKRMPRRRPVPSTHWMRMLSLSLLMLATFFLFLQMRGQSANDLASYRSVVAVRKGLQPFVQLAWDGNHCSGLVSVRWLLHTTDCTSELCGIQVLTTVCLRNL